MTKSPVIYQSIVWSCWKQRNVFSLVTQSPQGGSVLESDLKPLTSAVIVKVHWAFSFWIGILFLLATSLLSPVQYLTSLTNICILVLKDLSVYITQKAEIVTLLPLQTHLLVLCFFRSPSLYSWFCSHCFKTVSQVFLPCFPLKKVNVCIAKLS